MGLLRETQGRGLMKREKEGNADSRHTENAKENGKEEAG